MKHFEHFEIAAVKSCNLTCVACNHISPMYKSMEAVSPKELATDLKVLARHIRAQRTWILGGEPLLHKDIVELIRVTKASGIAKDTQVLTNGTLLGKMTDEFWDEVDQVRVSLYPGVTLDQKVVKKRRRKLKINNSPNFREMFSTLPNEDPNLVSRIYAKCQIMDKCIGLVSRYFYRCMRSSFIPEKVPHPLLNPKTIDGIKVEDSAQFDKDFAAYLNADRMPASCSFCVGTSGKSFPHTMGDRKTWMERHNKTIREMVDPKKI